MIQLLSQYDAIVVGHGNSLNKYTKEYLEKANKSAKAYFDDTDYKLKKYQDFKSKVNDKYDKEIKDREQLINKLSDQLDSIREQRNKLRDNYNDSIKILHKQFESKINNAATTKEIDDIFEENSKIKKELKAKYEKDQENLSKVYDEAYAEFELATSPIFSSVINITPRPNSRRSYIFPLRYF